MQLFTQIFFLSFIGLGFYELWKTWHRHKTWINVAGAVDYSYEVYGQASDAPPSEGRQYKIRIGFHDAEGQKRTFQSFQPFGHRFITFDKVWPTGYQVTVQYRQDQPESARIATPWIDIFRGGMIIVIATCLFVAARFNWH